MKSVHSAMVEVQREVEAHVGPSPLAFPKQPAVAKTAKLLAAARKYPCMNCGREGYTVAAHCNDGVFKGIGRKAPDWLVAFLCGQPGGCHDQADGRAGGLTKDAKRALWNAAYVKTVNVLFRDGWVTVA